MTTPQHARHARILPSFAVSQVVRPLEVGIGSVTNRDLLAWTGPLPAEHTCREVRDLFIKRMRARFDALWDSKVGVQLHDEWFTAMNSSELVRMTGLVAAVSREGFPELSLREVKDRLHLPVSDVLGVLARLEALYWTPAATALATSGQKALVPDAMLSRSRVSDEWRQRVMATLDSEWVGALEHDDLRFPRQDETTIDSWLKKWLDAGDEIPLRVIEICDRLLAADRATWMAEIEQVAHALASRRQKRGHWSSERQARWVAIFMSRYAGVEGRTLQQVGDEFGVTRERVRQMCSDMLDALQEAPIKLPALEKVLAAAARIAPFAIDEANFQLAGLLGEGGGLNAAFEFAEAIGLPTPAHAVESRARTFDGYKPIAIVDTTQEVSRWVTEALAYARQECMTVGCTNYLRIAGHLALQEGFAADLQTLQSIFVKAPGFRLLDESSGWFTLADSEVSAAGDRLRKLMSVVVGSTDLDTIVGCMATDDRWLSRETGRALSIPPLHVMSALFAEWNWLMSDKHNKYWVGEALDPSIELSRTEYAIFQVIEGLGVATKADVMNKVVGPGISPMAVNFAIASSPAFFKIERAIYTLHGRPINADALVNARLRRAAETSRQSLEKLTLDLTRPIKAAVVQSGSDVSIDRRVVYLPKYLQGHVHGDFLHSAGKYGAISVALNQQIRHVAVVAQTLGVLPKESFELIFNLADMTYEIAVLPSPTKTEDFSPVDNKQS